MLRRNNTLLSIAFIAMTTLVLFVLPGCANTKTSFTRSKYTGTNKPKEHTLGVMRFHELQSDRTTDIELGKIRGGYALRTPLLTLDDTRVMGVVSKSKEYEWFSGVQVKWEF